MTHPLRRLLPWFVVALAVAAGVWWWAGRGQESEAARYRTETVDRGTIVRTVSANGTLNPVTLVNVGTQVSGTVKKLYADFNDHVKAGQVLAELDDSLFKAQLAQDEANLASARASLKLAQANETRSRELYAKQYVARSDLDQKIQATAAARAQVRVAEAQIARDRTNLAYTVIRSPVAGVVVSRNIDVGQTVAASFQTPTLFQIAEDLTRMQIDTSMAEADVGAVKVGQKVEFTVDAYPNRSFHGEVRQVRLNPTIQQNVVTYDVVINVNNPEKLLLPGMTAYVTVEVARRDNVLRIPNAALRFTPAGAPPAPTGAYAARVYRLEGGRAVPVTIETGLADAKYTEVIKGALKAGEPLVVEDLNPAPTKRQGGLHFRPF